MTDIKELTAMAQAGSAPAQYELGQLYREGQLGVADLEKHLLCEKITELERANKVTPEQERELLFSGVLLTQNWQSVFILPLTIEKKETQERLAEFWDIHNEADAVHTLSYLSVANGHTPKLNHTYERILAGHTSDTNFETVKEMLLGFGYTNDELMTLPSLAAWDYGRLGLVARYTRQAGYINDAVAWDYIGRSSKNAATVYDNWRQYLAAYLLGRALWGNDCKDIQLELGFLFCSSQSPFRRGISLKPGVQEPAFDFVLYTGDMGVQKNAREAFRWYHKAAEQNHLRAQFCVGYLYDEGQGVPQDYGEALRWYHRAAEQNHTNAQFNIGYMYDKGHGVPQDDDMALKWYHKAADQNHTDALYNIGNINEYRKNNMKEAEKWYRLAAEKGDEDARKALERLANKEKPYSPLQLCLLLGFSAIVVGISILGLIGSILRIFM